MIPRNTLAAIHVAKKDINLDDDDYRAMLKTEAGVDSARDLDDAGARRVMLWFDNHGFKRNTRKGTSGDRRPIVLKARALWISLYQLDEVGNRRDQALDAFAQRITGKETLRFATNGEAGKVVEALKAWAVRVGWSPQTAHYLCELQRQRLGALDPFEVADADPVSNPDVTVMAHKLGERMRRLKLGTRHHTTTQTEGASIV